MCNTNSQTDSIIVTQHDTEDEVEPAGSLHCAVFHFPLLLIYFHPEQIFMVTIHLIHVRIWEFLKPQWRE